MKFFIIQWKRFMKWAFLGIILYIIYSILASTLDLFFMQQEIVTLAEKSALIKNAPICTFPNLPLWQTNVMKEERLKKLGRSDCSSKGKDWVYTLNGKFYIEDEPAENHGRISCTYQKVLRQENDMSVLLGMAQPIDNNSYIPADVMKIKCIADDGVTTAKILLGIKPVFTMPDNLLSKKRKIEGFDLDIIIFGFSSMSRLQWKRLLPKSYNWFRKIGGVVLEGYNIVGDGRPQQLLPMLTGFLETNLYEARRGYKKARHIDDYPWIWHSLKSLNYVTQYGEDLPQFGTFTYRMVGFKDQPVDHYMRPFYIQQHDSECSGAKPTHQVFMDYLKEFINVYGVEQRKFSFLFQNEAFHANELTIDEDLVSLMIWLNDSGVLENSLFILMSDHGPNDKEARSTEQGKYEERMPFVGVRLPQTEAFKMQFPSVHKNLVKNSKLLTTPLDLYASFLDVMNYRLTGTRNNRPYTRFYSLFKPIPPDRTCYEADVAPYYCTCLQWYRVPTTDLFVNRAAQYTLERINNLTMDYRYYCAKLYPHKLTKALLVETNKKLLIFRRNVDEDGRVPDLTDDMESSLRTYQIIFSTKPNNAVYEARIDYLTQTDEIIVSTDNITRYNSHNSQSRCISKIRPDLSIFCYCTVY